MVAGNLPPFPIASLGSCTAHTLISSLLLLLLLLLVLVNSRQTDTCTVLVRPRISASRSHRGPTHEDTVAASSTAPTGSTRLAVGIESTTHAQSRAPPRPRNTSNLSETAMGIIYTWWGGM